MTTPSPIPEPLPAMVRAYRAAISRVSGEGLASRFSFPGEGPVALAALGKAAPSMMKGALAVLGGRAASSICISQEEVEVPGCLCLRGDHPFPGPGSLAAGRALLHWLDSLPRGLPLWVLLSGGASSLVELPLPGKSLEDLKRLGETAFAQGWDIQRLNEARAELSQIKGGKLARESLAGVLVMSDVPLGRERWVGSGPFWTPDTAGAHTILATRQTAAQAAAEALESEGFRPVLVEEMEGDLNGFRESRLLPSLSSLAPGEALVFFGELTLEVKPGGMGGRCQQLVLTSLPRLGPAFLLAAGTDGRDGPTDWAGAVGWGQELGEDGSQAAEAHKSTPWLSARGMALPRWNSGTNLNDLVLAVRPA